MGKRVTTLTLANLQRLENNRCKDIHNATLDELCRALQCSPGDLYHVDASIPHPIGENRPRKGK
ncbi:MAG: helix-turn-helix domain-containing protein [Merismopedia sp. SIO2A8]|nr:helix-turn-helix domain-containing protein [Symploca sp. SIO2B6]NET47293.1 helix-turn-helix domain-containing protein [Merismopedia sp. SIO2A8]